MSEAQALADEAAEYARDEPVTKAVLMRYMDTLLSASSTNLAGFEKRDQPKIPTQPVPTKMPDFATAQRPDNCHSSITVSTPCLADLQLDDKDPLTSAVNRAT